MAMTFLQLRQELIPSRFTTSDTTSVNNWLNNTYARLWGMEDWTFKKASGNVTVTSGSSSVTGLPSMFGIPNALYDQSGGRLRYLEPSVFNDYYANSTAQGSPQAYTVINQAVTVGPTSNVSSSAFLLLYEKRLTLLSADSDVPAIPVEHHYMLVPGALALGLAVKNDFTYQFMQAAWQESVQALRRDYLADQRGEAIQFPADPLY